MVGKAYNTPVGTSTPTTSKDLSSDDLFAAVRADFGKVEDHRGSNASIPLVDALMAGFAVFALKDKSLLAFDERRQSGDPNLHRVYGIENVPSDTQMREILDPIDPEVLRCPFKRVLDRILASCAFMLPVATPPNAVVFGSGYLRIPDMVRTGIWMNLLSIFILTLFVYFLVPLLWGLTIDEFPAAWK